MQSVLDRQMLTRHNWEDAADSQQWDMRNQRPVPWNPTRDRSPQEQAGQEKAHNAISRPRQKICPQVCVRICLTITHKKVLKP